MEQLSVKTRLTLAFLFEIVVFIGTAYLQLVFAFSTYVALTICIVAACIFSWLVVGNS